MMAQKIGQGWIEDRKLGGTVEVDGAFIGSKEKKQAWRQAESYSGTFGKNCCS